MFGHPPFASNTRIGRNLRELTITPAVPHFALRNRTIGIPFALNPEYAGLRAENGAAPPGPLCKPLRNCTGLFWMTSDLMKAAMHNPSTNRHDVVSAPQYHTDGYAQTHSSGSPLKWMLLGAAIGVLSFGALFGLYESHRAKAENVAAVAEAPAAVAAVVADPKVPLEERPLVHVRLKDGQELLVDEVRHDEDRQETALVIHIAKKDIAEVKALALADEDADAAPAAGDQVAQADKADNAKSPRPEEFDQPYIPRSGNTGHIGRHFVASDWVNDVAARQRRQQARLQNFLLPMRRFLVNYRNTLKRAGMKVPKELDEIIGEEPKPAPKQPDPPAVRPPAEAAPGPAPVPVQKPKSA
jgi:hypothetical protein